MFVSLRCMHQCSVGLYVLVMYAPAQCEIVSVCSGAAGRCKIFVGNLHKDTQLEELRSLFQRHGNVVEADIISNYAFVVSAG